MNRIDREITGDCTKEDILKEVLANIENLADDWDFGFETAIGPNTYLVAELEFKSIKLAQLASLLEKHFNKSDLPFQKLIIKPDGRVVEDLQVMDIVDFLYTHLT